MNRKGDRPRLAADNLRKHAYAMTVNLFGKRNWRELPIVLSTVPNLCGSLLHSVFHSLIIKNIQKKVPNISDRNTHT